MILASEKWLIISSWMPGSENVLLAAEKLNWPNWSNVVDPMEQKCPEKHVANLTNSTFQLEETFFRQRDSIWFDQFNFSSERRTFAKRKNCFWLLIQCWQGNLVKMIWSLWREIGSRGSKKFDQCNFSAIRSNLLWKRIRPHLTNLTFQHPEAFLKMQLGKVARIPWICSNLWVVLCFSMQTLSSAELSLLFCKDTSSAEARGLLRGFPFLKPTTCAPKFRHAALG